MEKRKIIFPWRHRLRKVNFKHPRTLKDLQDQVKTKNDDLYASFLRLSHERLKAEWNDYWDSIYAVGPFLKKRNPYFTIPFVVILKEKAKVYDHLLELSERLATPYLEFGIMPFPYTISIKAVDFYQEENYIDLLRTEEVSIKFYNKS